MAYFTLALTALSRQLPIQSQNNPLLFYTSPQNLLPSLWNTLPPCLIPEIIHPQMHLSAKTTEAARICPNHPWPRYLQKNFFPIINWYIAFLGIHAPLHARDHLSVMQCIIFRDIQNDHLRNIWKVRSFWRICNCGLSNSVRSISWQASFLSATSRNMASSMILRFSAVSFVAFEYCDYPLSYLTFPAYIELS